jgi:hypothetical protein
MNDATQFFDTVAGAGGYQIERSLRFNSSDSAYLSRTPASAGNRKTWTWAGWVKLSSGTRNWLFSASESVNSAIEVFSDGRFYVYHGSGSPGWVGWSGVLRDYSAWYHITVVVDTTQATEANRIKAYINGNQITFNEGNQPAQNYEPTNGINSTSLHNICRHFSGSAYTVNCYLADIHFIDGQALDPTSFGEFDTNGVWQPKAYAGSYGTNGFHLPFSDNSTAAALGTDTSGNGNTWTVNNLSVTAGAGNDSLVDSPTNYGTDSGAGGEVRGNYATLNPLDRSTYITVNNGNLDAANPSQGSWYMARGTIGMSSEKWYWEVTATNVAGGTVIFGIANGTASLDSFPGNSSGGHGYGYNGTLYGAGSSGDATAISSGDVIGFAFNADAGTLALYRNGALQSGSFSGLASGPYFPAIGLYTPGSCSLNFGQRPFAYTAPSGFKALCTTNLAEPTIADGSTAMDVKLYTGNGSTQTISGLGFSPDLAWVKSRSSTYDNILFDTVRTATKQLISNSTGAEATYANSLTAFNSDGFSVGSDAVINNNASTYVAWTWDAGSSTVTNTQGSITSQVRANPGAGFSVVTYTGIGSAITETIGHGLGVAPSFMLVKQRNQSYRWNVYHKSVGGIEEGFNWRLELSSTNAAVIDYVSWGGILPTSTVFSMSGNAANELNINNGNYVAYCFAPVAGYSSFGSYTGNGLADGPFVYTGFRPRWVLIKAISLSSDNWWVDFPTEANANLLGKSLAPNSSIPEASQLVDFLSNGFKVRNTYSSHNQSGSDYIYAAFAEHPFATARAR